MQIADKFAFKQAFTRLCAAYNTPPTAAREDAYFRAFAKQTVGQFERLVDLSLEDPSVIEMPTVGVLRGLQFKRAPEPIEAKGTPQTVPEGLVEYCMRSGLSLTPKEIAQPWTYTYRRWIDGAGNKAAECTGVRIEREDGSVTAVKVADMRGAAA